MDTNATRGRLMCFVQLGKYGDLMNLLPAAKFWADSSGIPTVIVVGKRWADLLDGCSYVVPDVLDLQENELEKAITHATMKYSAQQFQGQYYNVVAPQVYCNPIPRVRDGCFLDDQWARTGLREDLWHSLPLVFDRRAPDREARLLARNNWTNTVLVFCSRDGAGPFPMTSRWLLEMIGQRWFTEMRRNYRTPLYGFVDMTNAKADRIYDLLAVMEKCAACICTDSAPLHLTYACRVPTVALVNNTPWLASKPRPHWIGCMDYAKAVTPSGIEEMGQVIRHHGRWK